MSGLVILMAASIAGTAVIWFRAPRSAAMFCTDGDSERVRRINQIEPWQPGEILPVMPDAPPFP